MSKDYIKCPYCGRILPPDAVYCDQCHNEIAEHKKAIKGLIGTVICLALLVYCGFVVYERFYSAPQEQEPVKTTLDPNSPEVQAFLKKYSASAQRKINAVWLKEDIPQGNYKAIITYRIAANGYVISKEVTVPSGNKAFDGIALYAIEKASPFDPIPSEYANWIDGRHIFQTDGYAKQ